MTQLRRPFPQEFSIIQSPQKRHRFRNKKQTQLILLVKQAIQSYIKYNKQSIFEFRVVIKKRNPGKSLPQSKTNPLNSLFDCDSLSVPFPSF